MSLETQAPPAQSKAPRLGGVDGLRGLAAVIVLLFHTYNLAGAPDLRVHHVNVLRPLTDGWAAVNLFLVLSGFCLYWPYADRAGRPRRPLTVGDYARRRSVRILPTYYASLVFVTALGLLLPALKGAEPNCFPRSWGDGVGHALLLNAWNWKTINSWNSVTWSLSLEWTWYAVFPLALLLFRRVGPGRAFGAMVTLDVLYRVGLRVALGRAGHYDGVHSPYTENFPWAFRNFVVGRLFEFGVGMYVASWVARGRSVPAWYRLLGPVVVLALIGAARAAEPVDVFLPVRDVLYGSASAALLLLVVVPGENPTKRVLGHPAAEWLGQFSYTLYLFHLGLLAAVNVGLARLGFTGLKLFAVLLACEPFIVLASWALYLVVERPFVTNRPRQQPVAPPDALIAPAL